MIRGFFLGKLKHHARRYAGAECYVFGDGPSIKWFDLHRFADKPAICCNMFPFHREFGLLDVRYCTLTTPLYFAPRYLRNQDYLIEGQTISREYRQLVRSLGSVEFLFHLSNYPFIRGANVNFAFRRLPRRHHGVEPLLNRFRVFSGAFYSTLALAYFLGFARVYLIGFDGWTIQPARAAHWYEFGEGPLFEPTNLATDFLAAATQEMEISTISVEGESRNVRNIPYRMHTGHAPKYRENHELLEPRHLEVLATYPRYRIYGD